MFLFNDKFSCCSIINEIRPVELTGLTLFTVSSLIVYFLSTEAFIISEI